VLAWLQGEPEGKLMRDLIGWLEGDEEAKGKAQRRDLKEIPILWIGEACRVKP